MQLKSIVLFISTMVFITILISCDESVYPPDLNCNLKTTYVDSSDILPYSDKSLIFFSKSNLKFPENFYQEDLNNGNTYYLNTVSTRESSSVWIEYCTDDSADAHYYSELSNSNQDTTWNTVIEKYTENERYYQFRRISNKYNYYILLHRVHKCGYLDVSMYDRLNKVQPIGIFKKRPMTITNVRELCEYLYFIREHETNGRNVLNVKENETLNYFEIIIYFAGYSAGDYGMCPSVSVTRRTYKVYKDSGEIFIKNKIIRVISND